MKADGDIFTLSASDTSTVLQTNAATALETAAASKNDFITLNSALRSSAQQYLLYKWKANGQCSQTNPVATPGTSNHEAGKAIDVDATTYWRSTLAAYSFRYAVTEGDSAYFISWHCT
jgi:N-acetylmuramoyl-L-alanine amidase